MDTFLLEAESRPQNMTVSAVRRGRKIPAVFYGKGQENLHLTFPASVFKTVYKKAGESNLVDLDVDGGKKKFKVLIHTVHVHPVTDDVLHVDLINVRMDQKLMTRVPLKLAGIAPAVKDFAGIISTQVNEIEIRCLPSDLIHEVVVDISGLKTLHDSIHVKDLSVPAGIEIMMDKERTLISVLAPKKEEEVTVAAPTAIETAKAEEAAAAAAAPAEEGKKEKKEEKK